MIHMLSKFDLKEGCTYEVFNKDYTDFIAAILELNLIQSCGPIGQRVKNTEMDTAGDDEPEYFSIMSFENREQLDNAYAYLLKSPMGGKHGVAHLAIHKAVTNSVFICWEDIDS